MRTASRQIIASLLVLVSWIPGQASAELPPAALKTMRDLAIQHKGRLKPFDSFARETVRQITGSAKWRGADPVTTVLAIMSAPERWQDEPFIAVPFVPLRERLGLDRGTRHVSFDELVATRSLMRMLPAIVEKEQRSEPLSMLDNETMDLYRRFVTLSQLLEQELYLVPPPSGARAPWVAILNPKGYPTAQQTQLRDAWTSFVLALREGRPDETQASARRLASRLQALNPQSALAPWRLQLEVLYNRLSPFRAAASIYLVSFFGLLLSLIRRPQSRWALGVGWLALWAAFVVHGSGIIVRVVVGGRPPVSNFYETMLWLPFVTVALAIVFERLYRVRYFGLAAAGLSAITLWMAGYVPLDASIAPVVAVLRSNLWLTVHVLTIVASYGALALAMGLAHIYGWLYLARRVPITHSGGGTGGEPTALATFDLWLYRAIQVGVVLLAGGIMLGAVWANASWGRYWGWDPKETWALITLLWYLAILHGRFAGWINGVGVALATIGGFFLLLMTYYGVSFYLVGLHSYAGGHAKPLPPLLIAYLLAELAFLAAVGWAALRRRRLT